jgi:hypothetical protein
MNTNHILTEFDRERRNPGDCWHVLEFITHNADLACDFGFVSYSCFPPDKLDMGIKEQIECFSKLNQEFEWKVFEHDKPRDLREKLVNFGFIQGPPEAFMIVDLKNLNTTFENSIPCMNLRITRKFRLAFLVQDMMIGRGHNWRSIRTPLVYMWLTTKICPLALAE